MSVIDSSSILQHAMSEKISQMLFASITHFYKKNQKMKRYVVRNRFETFWLIEAW